MTDSTRDERVEVDELIADCKRHAVPGSLYQMRPDILSGKCAAELERLRAEVQRDYDGMREFQAKFIEADHRARAAEARAAAAEKDAKRYQVARNGCRVDSFGLWAIIPDDPHDLESVKCDFDADIDAAIAQQEGT